MNISHKFRLLALLAAGVIVSCNVNESSDPHASGPRTVEYTPKLMTLRGGPVPVVDLVHVRLWIGDTIGRSPEFDQYIPWDNSSVKIPGLAVGEKYTVVIDGIKIGMDESTRSIWWTTSKSGTVPETASLVHTDSLSVSTKDMILPAVSLPQVPQDVSAEATKAELSFDVPGDAVEVLVGGVGQTFVKGDTFRKDIPLEPGQTKTVVIRIIDGNQNVWQDTVVFRRASGTGEPDRTPPTIALIAPSKADTVLPMGAVSIAMRVRVEDASGLKSVSIGGKAAVTADFAEWSADAPLQSGSNTIWVHAVDKADNKDSIRITAMVPAVAGDVRLSDLGLPTGYATAPAGEDSVWNVTVPNSDTAIDLTPKTFDRNATLLFAGAQLEKPLHVSLPAAGGQYERTVAVRSGDGQTTKDWRIRIRHLGPDKIALAPRNGKSPAFAWADSTPTLAWTVAGSRALGRVVIDGQAATCASGTCSGKVSLPVGSRSVVIAASYADLPDQSWSDTVTATRASKPASNEARLLTVGASIGTVDTSKLATSSLVIVEVDNSVTSVTLAPKATSAQAAVSVLPGGKPSILHTLSAAGDSLVDTVDIVAEDGVAKARYFVRIRHLGPEAITLTPVGGSTQTIAWADSQKTVSWAVRGSRTLGRILIDGQTATCVRDTCSLALKLPEGLRKVGIAASYEGIPQTWTDTIAFTRLAKPASGDAGLANFGTGLTETMVLADSVRKVVVPNSVDTIVLAPATADRAASFTIDGVAQASRKVGLALDGDTASYIVVVTSEDGKVRRSYRLVVEHPAPAPIVFEFVGGKAQTATSSASSIRIQWSVTGSRAVRVGYGPESIALAPVDGIYTYNLALGAPGIYKLPVQARYVGGSQTWADTFVVTKEADVLAPTLSILTRSTVVGPTTTQIVVRCQAMDNDRIAGVMVGSTAATALGGGEYEATVLLAGGANEIVVTATDAAGNTSRRTVSILRDVEKPAVVLKNEPSAAVAWLKNGVYAAQWQLTDNYKLGTVMINGQAATVSGNSYSREIAYEPGRNVVQLVASDSVGNILRDSMVLETKLADADGNWYKIRRMPNGAVWMGQNLRTLPRKSVGSTLGCHGNDCVNNGRWYYWHQAMDIDPRYDTILAGTLIRSPMRGLCPDGWHVTTSSDWSTLLKSVAQAQGLPSTDSAGVIPLKTSSGWSSAFTPTGGTTQTTYYNGTNRYDGFIAPNYGYSYGGPGGGGGGTQFHVWTTREEAATDAEIYWIANGVQNVGIDKEGERKTGMRCVAD